VNNPNQPKNIEQLLTSILDRLDKLEKNLQELDEDVQEIDTDLETLENTVADIISGEVPSRPNTEGYGDEGDKNWVPQPWNDYSSGSQNTPENTSNTGRRAPGNFPMNE